MHPGLYRGDDAVLIPKVESETALGWFLDFLPQRKIDAVLVGSEFDLAFFARHRQVIEAEIGTKVCASSPETVAIADDKFVTAEFFRRHGLPYARAIVPKSAAEARKAAQEYGLPVVLKSRTGTSARNVHIIYDLEEIDRTFGAIPNPMLQEFAGSPGDGLQHEYTCSVFTGHDSALLGPFTARRTLRGGSSWVVEVGHFTWLHPLMIDVARALPSVGSINVQLRDGPKGPIPFEINARFSGTTAIRAHFGFNEPEMYLRSFLLGEALAQPITRTGVAFRYAEEVFVDNVRAVDLVEPFPKGIVHPWF